MTLSTKKSIDYCLPLLLCSAAGFVYVKRNTAKDWKVLFGIVILTYVLGYVLTSQLTKQFWSLSLDADTQKVKDETVRNLGITTAEFARAEAIAELIYKAFHDSWSEDEDAAIDAINTTGSVAMVKAVRDIYKTKYSKSLTEDFDEFCTSFNYSTNNVAGYIVETLGLQYNI